MKVIKSILDESEGNGVSFTNPWDFVFKELLTKDEYEKGLSFYKGDISVESEGDLKLKSWGFVIEQLSMNPYPTKDMERRKQVARKTFEGMFKHLSNR
ncbi:MAG: hypothetical protein HRT88_20545 [Lentisphaeraceae bacterium]|nr:hypothetical protein [Lentisphaeraceae bacterium]